MKRKYVALGSCFYGIGYSIREALRYAKKSRPTYLSKEKLVVYMLPEGATTVHISEMGRLSWDGAEGTAVKIDY